MLNKFLDPLVAGVNWRLAVAGNDEDVVDIEEGENNRIYARLGGTDGPVIEVHISLIHPNLNDVIYVQQLQSIGAGGYRMVFWLSDGAGENVTPPIVGSTQVPASVDALIDDDSAALLDDDSAELTV